MGLLEEGNKRRKTDSTDANATSSRSHAVLEIVVRRVPRDQYVASTLLGKLSLVDLAGSERAAETNNMGQVRGVDGCWGGGRGVMAMVGWELGFGVS